MKERLMNTKNLVLRLAGEIKKLENKIEPINQELEVNENIIKGKQQLLERKTSELNKIKEDKVVKFLLSPMFNIIPIGITVILTLLSLIFSTALLFILAIIFGLSYICLNAITSNILKKDLPEVILEKLSLEYSNCISEIAKLKEEIEYLNRTNKKLVTNNRPLINELDSKRKELESLILPFLVELIVETAEQVNKQENLDMNGFLKVMGDILELSATEEEPPKVKSIGTMPRSETL